MTEELEQESVGSESTLSASLGMESIEEVPVEAENAGDESSPKGEGDTGSEEVNDPAQSTETESNTESNTESDAESESDVDNTDSIIQESDGSFRLGKFKAATLEELALEINKSRHNVEKLVGKKKEDIDNSNPFLNPQVDTSDDDDFYDEFADDIISQDRIVDDVMNRIQGQYQPQFTGQSLERELRQALSNPDIESKHFGEAINLLIQHDPTNVAFRDEILEAWAQVDPFTASKINTQLMLIDNQFQQELRQQEFQQQQEAALAQQSANQQAFQETTQAFLERNPDAGEYNVGISEWFGDPANKSIIDASRGNNIAMYQNFMSAYYYAKIKAGKGFGVSNIANDSSRIDDGSLETIGQNNINFSTNNDADTPTLSSFLGMDTV